MEISVIIPTYNNSRVLEHTIAALLAQAFPAESYEVIVATSPSATAAGRRRVTSAPAARVGVSWYSWTPTCGPPLIS